MNWHPRDVTAFSPVAAARLDAIFATVFGGPLLNLEFEAVTPRKWVRSSKPAIRELFLIQTLKGASYSATWGFSLDYVPHLAGDKVAWHRTPKSALLDLRYDPIDYLDPSTQPYDEWFIRSLHGEERAAADARRVCARAIPLATAFFDPVQHVDDLRRSFKAQIDRPAVRFGFHNHIQQPLAYLFTLAKLGHRDEAEALLERYVADYGISTSAAGRLRELVKEA
jgi:hypothetical protein